jgi:hypothetical protein
LAQIEEKKVKFSKDFKDLEEREKGLRVAESEAMEKKKTDMCEYNMRNLAELTQNHSNEMSTMKSDHSNEVETLKKQHSDQL